MTYCPTKVDAATGKGQCFAIPSPVCSLSAISAGQCPGSDQGMRPPFPCDQVCAQVSGGTHNYSEVCNSNAGGQKSCNASPGDSKIACCTDADCTTVDCFPMPYTLCSQVAPPSSGPPSVDACRLFSPAFPDRSKLTTFASAAYKLVMKQVVDQMVLLYPQLAYGVEDLFACSGVQCSGRTFPLLRISATSNVADADAMLQTLNNVLRLFYPGVANPPSLTFSKSVDDIINLCDASKPQGLQSAKSAAYANFMTLIATSPVNATLMLTTGLGPPTDAFYRYENVFQMCCYLVNWDMWKPCIQSACSLAPPFDPTFCAYVNVQGGVDAASVNDCNGRLTGDALRVLFSSQILLSAADRWMAQQDAQSQPPQLVPVAPPSGARSILSDPTQQESLAEIMVQTYYNAFCS